MCRETFCDHVVCKIPLLARALGLKAEPMHYAAARPSARDDRVSCIQVIMLHLMRVTSVVFSSNPG